MNTIPFPRSERGSIRHELAEAIEIHHDAEARTVEAHAIATKAARLAGEAADRVEQLRSANEAAVMRTNEAHGKAISDALRRGLEPPSAPTPPQVDFQADAAARAHCQALEASARELSAEAAEANAAAAAAYEAVRKLARAIVAAEAADLAAAVISTIEQHWVLFDKLAGLLRLEGGSALDEAAQADIVTKINRRRRAIADNALMREDHNYDQHLEGIAATQERKWNDYLRRLTLDAEAHFDE